MTVLKKEGKRCIYGVIFCILRGKIWAKMSETGKKSPREIVMDAFVFSAKTDRN